MALPILGLGHPVGQLILPGHTLRKGHTRIEGICPFCHDRADIRDTQPCESRRNGSRYEYFLGSCLYSMALSPSNPIFYTMIVVLDNEAKSFGLA